MTRVTRCLPSLINPDNHDLINPVNEYAQVGNAIHSLLALRFQTGVVGDQDFQDAATEHGVDDISAVRIGFFSGLQAIDELQAWYSENGYTLQDTIVEKALQVDLGPVRITGHPDVAFTYVKDDDESYKVLVPVDFKLKNIDGKMEQVMSYALQLLARTPSVMRVDMHLVSLLGGERFTKSMSPPQMFAWFRYNLLNPIEQYRDKGTLKYSPGRDNCMYCPIRYDCKARAKWRTDAVRTILNQHLNEDWGINLTPEEVVEGYESAMAVKDAVNDVINHLKDVIESDHKGEIVVRNKRLYTEEVNAGTDVLFESFEEFEKICEAAGISFRLLVDQLGRVSDKKVKDAAKARLYREHNDKPPRGAIGELMKELDEKLEPWAKKKTRKEIHLDNQPKE